MKWKCKRNKPKPTMPRVCPRIRVAPDARSNSCSGQVMRLSQKPTSRASQYVRRYMSSIRHSVVSAASSMQWPPRSHTAIPVIRHQQSGSNTDMSSARKSTRLVGGGGHVPTFCRTTRTLQFVLQFAKFGYVIVCCLSVCRLWREHIVKTTEVRIT